MVFQSIQNRIKSFDMFHHIPSQSITFNSSIKHVTFFGGVLTLLLGPFYLMLFSEYFIQMLNHSGTIINTLHGHTNYTRIREIKMEEMNTLPFFQFIIKERNSKEKVLGHAVFKVSKVMIAINLQQNSLSFSIGFEIVKI